MQKSDVIDDLIDKLISVEENTFPPDKRCDREYMEHNLKHPKGINIIAKNERGEIIGYITSLPIKDSTLVPDRGYEKDKRNSKILYVSDIAILPEYQDSRAFLKIFLKFKSALRNAGFEKITCHTETEGGVRNYGEDKRNLSKSLQVLGFKIIKQEPHWCGGDECYDYLMFDIGSRYGVKSIESAERTRRML
jgi:ribosomal protein S18 acetylase RimI-like enzyme